MRAGEAGAAGAPVQPAVPDGGLTAAALAARHGITPAQALGLLVIAAMKTTYSAPDQFVAEVLVMEDELQLKDPEADDDEQPPSPLALRMREATRARMLDQAALAGAAAARNGNAPELAREAVAHGLAPEEIPAFAAVGVVLAHADDASDAVADYYAVLVDALAQRDPTMPEEMRGTAEAARWFAAERDRQLTRIRAVARTLAGA